MPPWSVQEWRARIGTSWCALGRPIKAKVCGHREGNCSKSQPPGCGRRMESRDGIVYTMIMTVPLIGAILTLWCLVLGERYSVLNMSELTIL